MRDNKRTIIVCALLWIPLAVFTFFAMKDEALWRRIVFSILSGPALVFVSALATVAVSLLLMASFSLLKHLEVFDVLKEIRPSDFFQGAFAAVFGLVIAVSYYYYITGQQFIFSFLH